MNKPFSTAISRAVFAFTYVEMMVALAIASLILLSLTGVLNQALHSQDAVTETNRLARDARFALRRMTDTIAGSRRLLLPLADNPNTNWPENIREQTIPASAPIGDSTLATAVLAVTLPATVDLDLDGVPDADNDGDGLIDEDPPGDTTWDNATGIVLIDDDGDGSVDEGASWSDDDEAADVDEDPHDALDNDADSSIDEDTSADYNGDGCAGICGVDDDADGAIDEGDVEDDDEDGQVNEDYYDSVVIYLAAGVLKERISVPWDQSGDGQVNGLDYLVSDIAENVTRFRVERVVPAGSMQLLDITLELTSPISGETINLHTQVRLGGAL